MSRPPRLARRPPGRLSTVLLAGWLFADLLLVLTVVSLSDQPDPLAAAPSPTPSPASSPSPSPSPAGPRSVEKAPVKVRVDGDTRTELVGQLKKETGRWARREAALVLTFGGSSSGTRYAHRVNSLLGRARPGMFTKDTATEDFHALSEPADTAELWVYFYTSPR